MRRLLFVAVAVISTIACTSTAATPSYKIQDIGLVGTGYEYQSSSSGGGTYRYSALSQLNALGDVIGYSNRFNSTGISLGRDSWLYTGAGTVQIGLIGDGYEYTNSGTGGGTYRAAYVTALNDAGEAEGSSNRYNALGISLGQDAWLFNGAGTQIIGLTGSGYDYTSTGTGGGTYSASFEQQMSATGQVAGYTNRYNPSGTSLGTDAWVFNGTTTQLIGLTGAGYEYTSTGTGGGTYRHDAAYYLNAAGQVLGGSIRYNSSGTSLGTDAWMYSGGTTQLIGLTGTGYEYPSTATGGGTYRQNAIGGVNAAGQATGVASRFNASGTPLGSDAWVYNAGAGTQAIGLTGTGYEYTYTGSGGGTYRSGSPQQLTAAGQVLGSSSRYTTTGTSLGADAWLYAGGTTQLVGLTGSGYEYTTGGGTYRTGFAQQVNAAGQVAGFTNRYSSYGLLLGNDAWFYTGTTTKLIGLTGDGYQYVSQAIGGGYDRVGSVQQLNDVGQVIGDSTRFTSAGAGLGQAGWFYDNSTGVTTPLTFSISSNGYSSTQPLILTDSGIVLGKYELFSGSADQGTDLFEWSLSGGFHDMGSLVNGGLSTAGWNALETIVAAGSAPDGSPKYITGAGLMTSDNGGQSDYLLTAVAAPEPSSLMLLLAGTLPALCHRRRASHAAGHLCGGRIQ